MLDKVWIIARYTALEALRNRLSGAIFIIIVASVLLAEFISQVAITESQEIQSAIVGSMLRMIAVVLVSLFVITSMVREFNDKGFELVLSFPIPRAGYYFGKLLGFSTMALMVSVLFCLPLLFYVPAMQVVMWGASLAFELFIITALSLLCMFTFRHVSVAFISVMSFYLLARTISTIQLIGHGPLIESHRLSQQLINSLVDAIAYLLPSFDRFTSTGWLVYHNAQMSDLALILIQSFIYLVLLSSAALFDLYRKNL